ncbi:MAG: NTP transferase domain-containing protein [Kiritimatiellae bacterium]|nr:NTP transferase domain-containing protein [Kiritimatiellia bacterium]
MKAVIPAAGHGTRFLPITRVVPKEMLPIGSRPALELIVDEAKGAGADEVVVVISRGKELIREYFRGDPSVTFVYQEEQRGLGHAVLQAADAVGGGREPFLVLLGDALVAGGSASQELAAVSAAHGGASVVGLEHVPRERVSRYGIVRMEGDRIVDMVEKPDPSEAPSDLAIAGRYLLDADVFGFLRTQTPGKGGEIQLTDAIRRLLAERPVYGCAYSGKRQDIGNPKGYFAALRAMGENE